MIVTTYESYRGGTNNVAVAIDSKTGEFSTSLKSKDHARRALMKKLARRGRKETTT